MNVKIFHACNRLEIQRMETEINEWFDANPKIIVKEIHQSATGRLDHKITVSIFYTINTWVE